MPDLVIEDVVVAPVTVGDVVVPAPTVVVDVVTLGRNGPAGQSAYDLAVDNGFVGSEAAWLESLVGQDGAPGTNGTNGTNGINGADGQDGADGAGTIIDNIDDVPGLTAALDAKVDDSELAAAIEAELVGYLQHTPGDTLSIPGNFEVENVAATKGYQFRTSGGNLDVDFAGADAYISTWTGAGLTGTQRMKMRLINDADLVRLIGRTQFSDSPYGDGFAYIDGATGAGHVASFQIGTYNIYVGPTKGSEPGPYIWFEMSALGVFADINTGVNP